jgi:hypothetical protein
VLNAFLKSTKHTYSFLWSPLIYLLIRHFSTNKWSDVRAFLEKPIWLSWIKLFSSRKLSSLLFSIITNYTVLFCYQDIIQRNGVKALLFQFWNLITQDYHKTTGALQCRIDLEES